MDYIFAAYFSDGVSNGYKCVSSEHAHANPELSVIVPDSMLKTVVQQGKQDLR